MAYYGTLYSLYVGDVLGRLVKEKAVNFKREYQLVYSLISSFLSVGFQKIHP